MAKIKLEKIIKITLLILFVILVYLLTLIKGNNIERTPITGVINIIPLIFSLKRKNI